ncbi:hypothetical protein ACFCYB_39200 [Streptomyces sp. NPDC056309]|uniref:hypothetical protein n=1 Tax=unclassified Streptomyces TaxID=2593676 RepID=UPI0035D815FF
MGSTPRKSTTDQPPSEAEHEESSGNTPKTGSGTVMAAREDADASPSDAESASASADRNSLRGALIAGGAALAACAGLVLYGVLNTGNSGDTAEHRVPAAPVTYEVTGEGIVDITYQARNTSGTATRVNAATLPWRTTVDVPLGQEPTINIVLGQNGGQARCALAIRGQHIQSATATGAFGRATCAGQLPHEDAPER